MKWKDTGRLFQMVAEMRRLEYEQLWDVVWKDRWRIVLAESE